MSVMHHYPFPQPLFTTRLRTPPLFLLRPQLLILV
jgi:hypothetical protein